MHCLFQGRPHEINGLDHQTMGHTSTDLIVEPTLQNLGWVVVIKKAVVED